jgi:hypothetical protein
LSFLLLVFLLYTVLRTVYDKRRADGGEMRTSEIEIQETNAVEVATGGHSQRFIYVKTFIWSSLGERYA